ncbi:MAG: hypothetical protein ACTSR5_03865 [Promethearchaeota archaeon]
MSEYISWSPIRRLMKHNGVTKTALGLTKHSKRKKVTKGDILLAIKYFK